MNAEQLSAIAGVVLSLACSYVPGVHERFERLEPRQKQAVMGALLVIAAIGVFAGACIGVVEGVECTRKDALGLISTLIAALVANQSTFLITRGRINHNHNHNNNHNHANNKPYLAARVAALEAKIEKISNGS